MRGRILSGERPNDKNMVEFVHGKKDVDDGMCGGVGRRGGCKSTSRTGEGPGGGKHHLAEHRTGRRWLDPVDSLEPTRQGPPVRGMRRGRVLHLGERGAPLRDAQPRTQEHVHRDDRRTSLQPRHPLSRHAWRHLQDIRPRPNLAGETQRLSAHLGRTAHGADLQVRVRPRQPEHPLRRRRAAPPAQRRARTDLALRRLRRDVADDRQVRARQRH